MHRQIQISNDIYQAKHEIEQLDQHIFIQNEKQKILDQLLKDLNYSSSQSSSSISSSQISSKLQRKKQQIRKPSQTLNINNNKEIENDLLQSSIDTEELSFQIDKIRMFQKNIGGISKIKTYQNTNQRSYQNKEQQGKIVNNFKKLTHIKQSFQLKQFPQSLFTTQKQKIPQIQFSYQQNAQKNTKTTDKIRQISISKKTIKISETIAKSSQDQKIRLQNLQAEKRVIREQLMRERQQKIFKQRQKRQRIFSLNHSDVGNQNITNIYKQNDINRINQSNQNYANNLWIQKKLQIQQKISIFDLARTKKLKNYTKYINKKLQNMNKTNQLINQFKRNVI